MKRVFSNPLVALVAGLCLRLYFVLKFPANSGDTVLYEQIATNWLKHHVYAMTVGGAITPVDLRMPGYPAFLAILYALTGRTGDDARLWVMLAQVGVDLLSCLVIARLAALLACTSGDPTPNKRAYAVALWLTALCPFTANYTAVPLTEVLATFFTTLSLLIFLSPAGTAIDRISSKHDLLRASGIWFGGGIMVGLGTLVRPETPLLLAAMLVVLWMRFRHPANCSKLALATLWMTAGLLLPLAPWAARNAANLGRVQFLAPRYAETYGDVLPTGFYAWTKTWMYRFRDAYLFTWKVPSQPIELKNLPRYAVDSPKEYAHVAALQVKRY